MLAMELRNTPQVWLAQEQGHIGDCCEAQGFVNHTAWLYMIVQLVHIGPSTD